MAKQTEPQLTPEASVDTPPLGQRVGYVRVSTSTQNPARQHAAIGPCDEVFEEKISGGTSWEERPQLTALVKYARKGDEVRVASMDRLGRDITDLRNVMAVLTEKGCSVHFVKESITVSSDKRDSVQRLLLAVISDIAEFERERIRERQAEGIALAKERGAYRKQRRLSPDDVEAARAEIELGVPVAEVARRYDVSRQTIYNAIRGERAYAPKG